ncbi:MAG TPA: VWA domain-containing protein [Pyrinomonadaceae bacterium]
MMRSFLTLALSTALAFLFLVSTSKSAEAQILQEPPPVMPKPTPKPPPPPKDEDYEVVRVTSNLIVVPVSVTDATGQPVLGLKIPDFRLEEEGRAQEITQMGDPEQTPLDIAILLDVSASQKSFFTFEQQAATAFLKQVLKPTDRATVFAIDEKPRFIQELTSAERASEKLMSILPASGYTAFYDTVISAANYLEKSSSSGRRKVIIAISDGDDTARIIDMSNAQTRGSDDLKLIGKDAQLRLIDRSVSEVQREIQRDEITFYSLNPSGQTMFLNVRTARAEQGMEKMTEATGGASFTLSKLAELNAIFNRIAAELRSQYLLQYYSNNETSGGNYRSIKVAVPTQPQLRVRARQGYYPKGK